jgi:hypothetical protein
MELLARSTRAPLLRRLALLCVVGTFATGAAPVSEYQVKAVFLFNFAQFVEWPAKAFAQTNAPFVIGVVGKDPLGANLDDVVRGESINEHPFVVQRFASASDVQDCQILFIPAAETTHLPEILDKIKGRSVLTVSDAEDIAQRGVVIGFFTQDRQIRLRINVEAARMASLTISSKLLRPAEIVGTGRS